MYAFSSWVAFVDSFDAQLCVEAGCDDQRRMVDICQIRADVGDGISKALLSLHTFIGCDTTGARTLKLIQQDDLSRKLNGVVGAAPDGLDEFVYSFLGKKKNDTTNK